MKDDFDLIVKKYENVCLFCRKPIQVLCGTPLIYIGGCCTGFVDHKNKIQYVFPRKAHIHCWLKKNGFVIVKK